MRSAPDASSKAIGPGYRWDFANLALDVDSVGLPDLIGVDWFDKRAVWLPNIGTPGNEWPLTVIEKNGNFETAHLFDVNGDGDLDIAVTGKWGGPVWFENRLK